MLILANFCFAQLTVTTNPASATICAGNSISITASATPVSYTASAITNNAYDPTLFVTSILVDHLGTFNGGTPYVEPVSLGPLMMAAGIILPSLLPFVFMAIHLMR